MLPKEVGSNSELLFTSLEGVLKSSYQEMNIKCIIYKSADIPNSMNKLKFSTIAFSFIFIKKWSNTVLIAFMKIIDNSVIVMPGRHVETFLEMKAQFDFCSNSLLSAILINVKITSFLAPRCHDLYDM